MSLPRPTGLKAPSKISRPNTSVPRPSGIPAPGSGSGSRAQSALAKSARAAGLSAIQAERYASENLSQLRGGPEPSAQLGGTDDFKIGDRVWVSGTKPGVIAFIGEAQFAPGEWAGVALDEPIGKNDGSVAGVRYFQCEPMKGVFSRLSKLSRAPGSVSAPKAADASSDGHSNSTSQSSSVHNGSLNHTPARSQTPRIGLSGSRSKSGSNVSLNKDSPPTSTTNLHRGGLAMTKHGVKLGDRVIVSGTKTGILRYVGQTDFAKGEWAGVELEEPQGKNDGAVAGKRYFDCRPNYGLFAPIHKVARFTVGATPSPQSRSLANTSLRSARERSGSQESISSVSSTASSVSRSRASKTGQRPSTLNLSATTSALQKALKEKEEHIEQLLRERDLERAEVARAAAQVDEAEGALANVRHDREMMAADSNEQIRQMREIILELEKEKKGLVVKLEEEKRKCEDLQFQIEEEVISKDDLECRTEEDEEKLRSLERNHKKEKERADKFERELTALKEIVNQQQTKLKQADDTQTTYLDQMEELTYKLNQAENKIKTFESSRLEEGAKTSQVSMELDEKSNRVTELEEALTAQRKEIKQLQDKLVEVKDDLTDTNNKKQKMQDTITDMTNKLEASEKSQTKLSEEMRSMKSKGSDLQRQLATSKEKVEELTDDRNKLEAQLSDLMTNSGDSSKQLSLMNDQVAEKTRKIEELQSDLSSSTQKVAILNETIEQLKLDGEKEKEDIVNRSREEVKAAEAKLEDVQTELGRTKTKIDKLTEYSEKEKVELEEKKDWEVTDLKKQLAANAEELEKQEVQTQAHKQVLDQITLERETMKFEKEKAEKNLKRTESEKDAINTELVQTRVELSKLQAESQQNSTVKQTMEEQVQIAHEDRDRAVKAKEELQKQFQDAQTEKEKVVSEKNQLQQDAMVTKADIQKKDIQIDELQKEVEKLKSETVNQQQELMQKSQSESDNSALSRNLEETKKQLATVQATLREAEAEKLKMTTELQQSQLVKEERKKLEEQNKNLQTELQENIKRYSDEKSSLEASKAALQSKVDNSSKELSDMQKQLEGHKKKVHDLENENQSLSSFKVSASKLEEQQTSDKNKLLDKVHSLEAMVKESQKNANNIVTSGDPEVAQLKADKDASAKQVEFLNSVIVELQRKNDELQVRLQAMEAGVFDNGDAVEGMDISPSRPRSAPRLFCDICEMFDLHDTDDCPKQAMSDSPPATHYHGDRKQTRPYCDICEEDTRHVEGMSDPETMDSPRVTSLPDVPEEDMTTLKKWEESSRTDKMLQIPTASKRSVPGTLKDCRKKTNTLEFTKNTKAAESVHIRDPFTGGHDAAVNLAWSNPAQMKSKLAAELGCDEDDIGDVPLISLQRLVSTDSNEEYPTDTIRLQQAIFKADKAIQKQSLLADSDGTKELSTSISDIRESKSNKSKPTVPGQSTEDDTVCGQENSSVDNGTSGESQPTGRGDAAQAARDASGNDQDSTDMKISDICSTSSGFGSGGLMEGLENLDYPDWYNDECDAEVASLELGQKEEPERKETNDASEDEELKMFEELEAELEKDEDIPGDSDLMKEETTEKKIDEHEVMIEPCTDEAQTEQRETEGKQLDTCLTDTKDDKTVLTETQTKGDVAEAADTNSGQSREMISCEDRPTLGTELKNQKADIISETKTENNPSDVPIQHADDIAVASQHTDGVTVTDGMVKETFENQSQEGCNISDAVTRAQDDAVTLEEIISSGALELGMAGDQNGSNVTGSSVGFEGNDGLKTADEVTELPCGPDLSESMPTEDEITIGTEAVGWTKGQSESSSVTSAIPDPEEFFEATTAMTAEGASDMSSITSCLSHVTDEPAKLEVEQTDGTIHDEFETPPSGSPSCVTPQDGASPCVTPPISESQSVTQSISSSPCVTPPRSPTLPMTNLNEDPPPQIPVSDSEADLVTRRLKKGRSSPTKRTSTPACSEAQSSNGKGKTESCVVS